jgi:hypothetical protein
MRIYWGQQSSFALFENGGRELVKNKRLFIIIGTMIGIFTVGLGIPLLLVSNQEVETAFTAAGTRVSEQRPVQTRQPTPALAASVPEENCTYPLEFWRERPAAWPEHVTVGERNYSREDMIEIFRNPEDNLALDLLRHLYTTFLNVLHGADMLSVEEVILDANTWLTLNPPGSPLSEFNRRRGVELISLLEGYNNGIFGPGICPDAPVIVEIAETEKTDLPEVAMLITETPTPGSASQQGGAGESAASPLPPVAVQPVQPPPPTNPPPPPTDPPPPPTPTNPPPPPPPPSDTPAPTLPPADTPPPPHTNTPAPTEPPTNTPPPPTNTPLPTLPLPTSTLVPTLPPPPPPPPDDEICTGALGAVTLNKLTVPAGASCTLNGTRVEGNIDVEAGATLVANSIFTSGNLRGRSASRVEVLSASYVGGNLWIEFGGSARITASSIIGNLIFGSNTSSIEAVSNQVGGNFEAEKNTGGVVIINNTINGNLKCKDNSPPPTGGGNNVGGNAEDQCAGL